MTATEIKDAAYEAMTSVPPVCINCEYFTQHYLPADETRTAFVPCNLGHCSNQVIRFKRAYNTCKKFQMKNALPDVTSIRQGK